MTNQINSLHSRVKLLRGDSLGARCARSSLVLGIVGIATKLIGLGSKMVLTRVILPQEMGLMVMVLSVAHLFEVLTEVGIKQAVIHHKNGADPDYLNMAWWFQVVRASVLYAMSFMLAPVFANFYFAGKEEILANYSMGELTMLVRIALLSILGNGLISPRAHVLEKEFNFGRSAMILQGGFALGTALTVALAVFYRNVWSITIGFTSISLFRCLISYAMRPIQPRLRYDKESFANLMHFARQMIGLPALTYIAFNMDVLVAGKLIDASSVGYYGMALVLATTPRDLFGRIIRPVLLPAVSEKQDEAGTIVAVVLKLTKFIGLLMLPGAALVVVCSPAILSYVFGPEYSAVAVAFSILCVCCVLLIAAIVFGTVFIGLGKPSKHRLFVGIRALLLAAVIYPATKEFGLVGTASSVLFANLVSLSLQVVVVKKFIGLPVHRYLASWGPGLVLTLPVLGVTLAVRYFRPEVPSAAIIAGSVTYVACLGCVFRLLKGLTGKGRYDNRLQFESEEESERGRM